MAKARIRKAKLSDAKDLANSLRPADLSELLAMHGQWADIEEIIQKSIVRSKGMAWAGFKSGQLIGLGGVAKGPSSMLVQDVGIPWVLGTDLLDKSPGTLTKAAVLYLKHGLRKYSFLSNYVDARHEKSIRWLKRLGFTFSSGPVPAGQYGMPFYSFYMERK